MRSVQSSLLSGSQRNEGKSTESKAEWEKTVRLARSAGKLLEKLLPSSGDVL